jgi:1,4-dihydroxy-2-naphthoate octaprenyltransferase
MADRKSDWIAGKMTLPVLIGDDITSLLYVTTITLAYTSVVIIHWKTTLDMYSLNIVTFLFVLLTIVPAVQISRDLLSARPYNLTLIVQRCLQHAPLPLVVIFVDCFLKDLWMSNNLIGHFFSFGFQLRCLPIYPYLYSIVSGTTPQAKK